MKTVYKFQWDCGRQGEVEGLFISNPETVERAIGETVYFGEILGKHSEIYGDLEAKDLKVVSVDEAVIAFIEEHGPFGHNPLHAINIDCEKCDTLIEEAFSTYGQKIIDECNDCDCPHKQGAVAE